MKKKHKSESKATLNKKGNKKRIFCVLPLVVFIFIFVFQIVQDIKNNEIKLKQIFGTQEEFILKR